MSGPSVQEKLPMETLAELLTDARGEGYHVLSISGGEPFTYKSLPDLVHLARSLGYRIAVTTNGMLLTMKRLAPVADCLEVLAVSLDGVPSSHNRIRNSDRAFGGMAANLDVVRSLGIRFGFIFTLTQYNLNELEWVYRFALDNGASLLQIHPLEMTGRAAETMVGHDPDAIESAYAFLEWLRLRSEAPDSMQIQLDFADRRTAQVEPDRFVPPPIANAHLARLVSPLVVASDGTVVPFVFGMHTDYSLGIIGQSRLSELVPAWRETRYPRLRALCQRTLARAKEQSTLPFFNWYELLVRQSQLESRSREPVRAVV